MGKDERIPLKIKVGELFTGRKSLRPYKTCYSITSTYMDEVYTHGYHVTAESKTDITMVLRALLIRQGTTWAEANKRAVAVAKMTPTSWGTYDTLL